MADTGTGNGVWRLVAWSFVGPGLAFLYERGELLPGISAGLWPIAFITLVAALGLTVGVGAIARKGLWIGFLPAIANGLVALFYGFLLVFFGLGGSR